MVEACESRVLLSAVNASSDGTNASDQLQTDYSAMLQTYVSAGSTTSGLQSDQSGTAFMNSMPDAGFGLNDFSGTAAINGTEFEPIVSPYGEQIDGAAAGFTESTMNTWQGTQQQTANVPTAAASPENGDAPNASGDSGTTDPWLAAFFGDGQNTSLNSAANSPNLQGNSLRTAMTPPWENAGGDDNLPEPTVGGGFTTTTTVNGDTTTTTYTLTSSISFESGSMAGGDQSDDTRWDIPVDWTDKAGTIPDGSDQSESDDGDTDETADGEAGATPKNESGARFKASTTITVSVTTGPYTAPDGSTGTTTSVTFTSTGSVVIMVSGSWSTGGEGNTGTLVTGDTTADTESSGGSETPPSDTESSMTRAPRELAMGGNGTSVSASGEYFWYAYATMTFSVTISMTTMDNGAAGGGLSVPSASFSLSAGSGGLSTDKLNISLQESSTSGSGGAAKSVLVKEKNVSGSATSFSLNLGGDEDASDDDADDDDATSSSTANASQVPAAPGNSDSAGGSDPADDTDGSAAEDDGPLSFSSTSHNSHKKTILYAKQSSQQLEYSDSSSSTNADIEDSSSGSTTIELSLSGFSYETKSKSKSEFSYISESQSSSDPPASSDGRPGSHSESQSSHVVEILDESESTFGFGFGSDGFEFTNEYSSNETVSDVVKSESKAGSWRLVYPTLTSSLVMSMNPQLTAPYWVAGPDLKMGSAHNIQFNYGGNLEDGFEGSFSSTTGFYYELLNQNGTIDRYEYTNTSQETFPNTNDGDDSSSDGASAGNNATDGSDTPTVGTSSNNASTATIDSAGTGDASSEQPCETQEEYDEKLFNYYQSLMQVMLLVGNELSANGISNIGKLFPSLSGNYNCTTSNGTTGLSVTNSAGAIKIFPPSWPNLASAISYSQSTYGDFSDWWLHDKSSSNPHGTYLGIVIPWLFLDKQIFRGSEIGGIDALIHEPCHDPSRYGIGHGDGMSDLLPCVDYFGRPIPPTSPFGTTWEQFIDFLQTTKDQNRVSLWEKMLQLAGPKPIPPTP